MLRDDTPAERHRRLATTFADRVRGTRDWDAPTPVAAWTARDVVAHLVDWSRGFLTSSADVDLPAGPAVDDDPDGAWDAHWRGVQALLDDPASEGRELSNPHVGTMPLVTAIDRIYTPDVFMHTWDLSVATGQDDRLDPDFCAQLLEGMTAMEAALRASEQFGTSVPVPADADPQTRLIAFIGRDPGWRNV